MQVDQVEGQGLTGLWAKERPVRKDPPRGETKAYSKVG